MADQPEVVTHKWGSSYDIEIRMDDDEYVELSAKAIPGQGAVLLLKKRRK